MDRSAMDPDDVKYIQKRINAMGVDAHPTEDAIVITYELEASLVGDLGDTMLEESKECQKIIRLKSLHQSSDLGSLAIEIVKRSGNLIMMSQVDEVKRILEYLKGRNDEAAVETKMGNLRPKTAASSRASSSRSSARTSNSVPSLSEVSLDPTKDILSNDLLRELKLGAEGSPSISLLDEYVEFLYEGIQDKVKGAALVLQLASNTDNLAELTSHETLLCALVRVLREDGRKSLELSSLIVGTFACFSTYSLFHPIVSQYKFGSLCLDIIQVELTREETWFRELTETHGKPESISLASSMIGMDSSTQSISSAPEEIGCRGQGHSPTFTPNDYEKSMKKYQHLVRKQNLLIRAAFYLLLNLSEDKKVEIKMVNKGIVNLLVKSLEREATPSFFVLIITFLKKLSIYSENKSKLYELGVVDKLYSLLSTSVASESNVNLIELIIGLLVNLSFDYKLRTNMIKAGLLQKLVYLLTKERLFEGNQLEQRILQILYQMSRDDRVKEMFNFSFGSGGTDAISLLINKVIRNSDTPQNMSESGMKRSFSSSSLGKTAAKSSPKSYFMELASLVINLAIVSSNARLMCEHGRLNKLLERAIGNLESAHEAQLRNVLLLKLIRNISQHEGDFKATLTKHVSPLMKLVFAGTVQKAKGITLEDLSCGSEDDMSETLVVECLGILGNVTDARGIDWLEQIKFVDAFEWMKARLKTGSCSEDDQVLEIAIFLGTCCSQEDCAVHLVGQELIKVLIELLNAKQEDDEIVLQVIFVFQVLTGHERTTRLDIKNSQVPAYLLDLMNDKNLVIKQICSATLDMIAESDTEWAKRIQMEKFKAHNKQWLEVVQSTQDQLNDAEFLDTEFGDDFFDQVQAAHPIEADYFLRPEMLNSSLDSDEDFPTGANHSELDRFSKNNARQPSFGSSRPQTGYKRRNGNYGHGHFPWPHNCGGGALSAINEHTLVIPRCANVAAFASSSSSSASPHGHPIFMPIQSRIDLSALSPTTPNSSEQSPATRLSFSGSSYIHLSG